MAGGTHEPSVSGTAGSQHGVVSLGWEASPRCKTRATPEVFIRELADLDQEAGPPNTILCVDPDVGDGNCWLLSDVPSGHCLQVGRLPP